jgi:hypothetical protein
MNKRIKQLVKQAGDYVNEVYTEPVRSKTPGKIWEDGHIGWHEQFNQKFAELIVRECCHVMESLPSTTYHVGRSRMSEEIKQHFGVKK